MHCHANIRSHYGILWDCYHFHEYDQGIFKANMIMIWQYMAYDEKYKGYGVLNQP
jgi:hypothetical protein